MTEKGSEHSESVSLDKSAATSSAPPAFVARTPERPKQVAWVVTALLASGLLAFAAALSLYGLHSFILHQTTVANAKLKGSDHRTKAQVLAAVHQQPTAVVIQSAIFFVVLVFVARAVWRGRYWSRWALIGVWILSTLEGIFGGASGLLYIGQSAPLALKVPVSLSSLAFLVALALVGFVRPIPAWLNLSRPARRGGAGSAQSRRGLSSQRDPVRAARQGISTTSPVGSRKVREAAARTEDLFRGDANTERARAKQRANTEAMQRGAAEARARARDSRGGRGSKSRRSGS